MAADKSFIISCVNDALKMEKSIYTLNEITLAINSRADAIQVKIDESKHRAERMNGLAHGSIDSSRNRMEKLKKNPIKEFYNEEGIKGIFACLSFGFFPGFLVPIFFLIFLGGSDKYDAWIANPPLVLFSLFIHELFVLAVFIIIFRIREVLKAKNQLASNEEQFSDRLKAVDEILAEVSKMENTVVLLREQARICIADSREIQKLLQSFYAHTDAIPVDYRKIDCILIFSHVFRNDLADTMREAVSYYETCVFRDKVIRGIKNIANKIDQLVFAADAIRDEIHAMNDGISQLVRSTESSNELLAQSVQESRAIRYATESLNNSVKMYNYYRKY